MEVRHDFTRTSERPLVLAIGFFDGFHRGHREIARRTLRMRRPGWRSGVLTFSNHPATHLRPGTEPPLISTPQERLDLFASAGFDECFFVRFDDRDRDSRAAGVPRYLGRAAARCRRCRRRDLSLRTQARRRHRAHGRRISRGTARRSSAWSRSRTTASASRARAYARWSPRASWRRPTSSLAGTGYEMRGPVEIGDGRGHALGFPTANVRVPEKLLPKDGVYAAVARYDGRDYAALVSIGTNPQFGGASAARSRRGCAISSSQSTAASWPCATCARCGSSGFSPAVGELIEQMQLDRAAVGYPAYG